MRNILRISMGAGVMACLLAGIRAETHGAQSVQGAQSSQAPPARPAPPRDSAAAQAAKGTGVITGRVVSDTGRPLRRAPGDYLGVALEYIEDGSWNDPEYLESLRGVATKFTVGEGESQTVALKLTTPKQ